MPTPLNIDQFLNLSKGHPVIDVRTAAEFSRGHIPSAFNLSLFDNEERAIVGTIYKQQGRQQAILKGLELVGPKMSKLVESAIEISNTDNTLFVHCWRGGMRSGSVSWLLEMYGFKVYTLKGGYKFFRRSVLNIIDEQRNYIILGGRTGSGKTEVLAKLREKGEQIIDLEKLAAHKGSSFGILGETVNHTQEHFENLLAMELRSLDPLKRIWLEDEGRTIGKKVLPLKLWEQMRAANVLFVELPKNERINYLIKEYGKFEKADLVEAVTRISRRLGSEQTKLALLALQENDLKTTCEICLAYYDKSYDHGLNQREPNTIKKIAFGKLDPDKISDSLAAIL